MGCEWRLHAPAQRSATIFSFFSFPTTDFLESPKSPFPYAAAQTYTKSIWTDRWTDGWKKPLVELSVRSQKNENNVKNKVIIALSVRITFNQIKSSATKKNNFVEKIVLDCINNLGAEH